MATRGWTSRSASREPQVRRPSCTVILGTPALACGCPMSGWPWLITTASSHDVRDLNSDIAVLPVGSFEQHGGHLPLSTDTLIAGAIASRIATDYELFLLPPIAIACSHEHAAFPGTVSISASTLHQVIRDVQECDRMLLYPSSTEWKQAWRTAGLVTGTHDDMHAGEGETSILLAEHRDVVRSSYVDGDWLADERRHLLSEGIRAYSESGVIGRPSLATADRAGSCWTRSPPSSSNTGTCSSHPAVDWLTHRAVRQRIRCVPCPRSAHHGRSQPHLQRQERC